METVSGANILKRNWFDVSQYGYVASKSATHAESIQATINAAAAAEGGTVFLPAGEYLLDKSLHIESPGVAVIGENRATKIKVRDVNLVPFHVLGSDIVLGDLEIAHDQPGPGDVSPWAPKPYQPAILVDGATRTTLKDIVFVNATSAISAKNPRGLTIRSIRGQPLQSGIQVDSANNDFEVSISDVAFEPSWWSADRRVLAFQHAQAVAFGSTDNQATPLHLRRVTANHYSIGFIFSGNTPPHYGRQSIYTAKNLFCNIGIAVGGGPLQLAVFDYVFKGLPGNQSVSGVFMYGSDIHVYVVGFRCDTTGQSAIFLDGPGNPPPGKDRIATFTDVYIKDWNQQANATLDAPEKSPLSRLLPHALDQISTASSATAVAEPSPAIFAGRGAYIVVGGEKTFIQTPPANWPISGGPGTVRV